MNKIETLKDLIENIFIIGGSEVYKEAIQDTRCSKIYLTQLSEEINCDTFFPSIPVNKYQLSSDDETIYEEKGIHFKFLIFNRK